MGVSLFLLAPLAIAGSPDWPTIASRVLPSTVQVHARGLNGNSVGSGFIVGKDLVATACHVVAGASQVEVQFSDGELTYAAGFVVDGCRDDLVVFRVPMGAREALQLAEEVPPVGSPVMTVGSPVGLSFSVSTGNISALRTSGSTSLVQHTAPISPGSSGGPVLDAFGKLVAVNSFLASADDAQNLNFAIASPTLGSSLRDVRAAARAEPFYMLKAPSRFEVDAQATISPTAALSRLIGSAQPGDDWLYQEQYGMYVKQATFLGISGVMLVRICAGRVGEATFMSLFSTATGSADALNKFATITKFPRNDALGDYFALASRYRANGWLLTKEVVVSPDQRVSQLERFYPAPAPSEEILLGYNCLDEGRDCFVHATAENGTCD